jgi:uncharacterized membrane protein
MTDADTLVRDYLGRLEAEARELPADRRADLVGEVREHIELALAQAGRRDEATVRTILDRLGPPETIVTAEATEAPEAVTGASVTAASASRRSDWGALEIMTVVLLTIGVVVLPIVGPLAGVVLMWVATGWTVRVKVVVTAVSVVLIASMLVLLLGTLVVVPSGPHSGPVQLVTPRALTPLVTPRAP